MTSRNAADFQSAAGRAAGSGLRGRRCSRALRETGVVPWDHPLHLLDIRSRLLGAVVVRRICLAVHRRDMRRVPVEIGASDSEFLSVRIDPLPELFGIGPTLVP